ncbi:hypothetical protein IHI24_000936 [Rickettsia endosymbiont of Cardiosporidium cionae]|nr:hypothetical protein IHI24_000936 [Rickettsia endosymbiont of Cardiosporidium cionae]
MTDGSIDKNNLPSTIALNPAPIDINITFFSVLNPNIVSNNTGITIPK